MPVPKSPAKLEVNRRLLHDYAFDEISKRIQDGTFSPGQDLTDETLIDMLGISRSPIRQALTMLVDVGLVDMAPNRYTRVAYPNPAEFLSGVQILSTLWALGAETSLEHLTPADVEDFDGRLEAVLELGKLNDPERAGELIESVHHLFEFFLERSGNPLLQPTVNRLTAQVAHTARAGAEEFDLPALGTLLELVRTGVHEGDFAPVNEALGQFRALASELLTRIEAH